MKPTTITQYINSAPKQARSKLRQMRAAIKVAAPGATESIKWSMPAFSYKRILVCFAAFEHHIGFYPGAAPVRVFKKDLKNYKFAKGSIQFPLDKPLPIALVKKLTKFRAKESLDKDVKWKPKK